MSEKLATYPGEKLKSEQNKVFPPQNVKRIADDIKYGLICIRNTFVSIDYVNFPSKAIRTTNDFLARAAGASKDLTYSILHPEVSEIELSEKAGSIMSSVVRCSLIGGGIYATSSILNAVDKHFHIIPDQVLQVTDVFLPYPYQIVAAGIAIGAGLEAYRIAFHRPQEKVIKE